MRIPQIMDTEFYNNTLLNWGVAIFLIATVYFGLRFIQKRSVSTLRKINEKKSWEWAYSFFVTLKKTRWFVILLLAIYIGIRGLTLPPAIENNLRIVAFAAFFIQIGLWAAAMLDAWSHQYRERQIKTNPSAVTTLGAVRLILHGIIWGSVILLILENMGLDITALVAGLGIGGVAVALATQSILGDLFASLSIVLDKTFAVGDFIILGEYMGTVENIGLKTTRIRSLSGEQIIFSNSDLLSGRIRNYGRMYERRVAVTISVTYETNREQLQKIPQIIRQAVESQEKTRFDRAHFFKYAESALSFEYVYYVHSPDYNLYMDIQQNINFFLHERFEKEGIEFSYMPRAPQLYRMEDDIVRNKKTAARNF